ncbi:general odorant-binding protein 83a-like [Topomyia yanbarensis]|uniref:general odorant-binding protein 83a-like n=1 Tax=Topomyia yanbarensis TaxID=2498891 RepID=UPI00273CD456|nr:general odorant-binding protein 83a-like [Topomyia yanbarensis]
MKLLLVLSLVSSCTVCSIMAIESNWQIPQEYKKPAKILHNMCVAESGASEELLRTCMDGSIHGDRAVKCYIHCLFDKLMVIKEDTGHIHLNRLSELAVNSNMKEAFEFLTKECGHIVTDDPCQTAYEVARCYFDTHDEVIKFCHLLVADLEI